MNLDQAAQFLGVSRKTLDRWVRQGLLAEAGLQGGRFEDSVLSRWAARRGIRTRIHRTVRPARSAHLLADAIERGAVSRAANVRDASEAIERAMNALDLPEATRAQLIDETLDRERLAATALGHGVAIPHPRQAQPKLLEHPLVSVLYLDPPIDWAAIDGAPVHTALLILSPNTPVHLQLLARIAYSLRVPGFDRFLAERPSMEELIEHVRRIVQDG